jgi:hypothetical protein
MFAAVVSTRESVPRDATARRCMTHHDTESTATNTDISVSFASP